MQVARILIVGDDQAKRTLFQELLGSLGHESMEAVDGQGGMEILRREPADLVITDL